VYNNPCAGDEYNDGNAPNEHVTGSPYDETTPASGLWHWPAGKNVGSESIELSSTAQGPICHSLNAANSGSACVGANCEEGWTIDGTRELGTSRENSCDNSITYSLPFSDVVTGTAGPCFTAIDNGDFSYFTSYLRIHNYEIDLDVEDLRNAQFTLGASSSNGEPGAIFSRIFTRRTIDIEMPFFITFKRTVEASADLAVTSSLFGFSAVVDYIQYVVDVFNDLEDGAEVGSGSGGLTLATSINPGYKLEESGGAIAVDPSGLAAFAGPTPVDTNVEEPYKSTSFGCATVSDADTVDGGTANRCEQFWKYTMTAPACSFAGIYSASWNVQCNKNAGAKCPGADSLTGTVYQRNDLGALTATPNSVAITFSLDAGPDDCVQEFENSVILSADLICSALQDVYDATDGTATSELFHNQMLYCHFTIDSGVALDSSAITSIVNAGDNGHTGDVTSDPDYLLTVNDPNDKRFQHRATPLLYKQFFDARNGWTITVNAIVTYTSSASQERRLLSLSPALAEQRSKCLENGCADLGPIRSLLQIDEEGGAVQGSAKAFVQGLDYQPDVPVVADDVYLADLDMGMEDEEDAAQPIVLNTLVLAGLGFLAMH